MLCFRIVSWFPLSCAFCPFSYMSHFLPHAVVFRYIYFSFASYCVSVFESRLFCSPLILVSRSWCLLLNSYLINGWPKLGFGIGRILEIIQPVSFYLPAHHHWDLQSLNAVPKVIQLGWSLTFLPWAYSRTPFIICSVSKELQYQTLSRNRN